MSGMLGKDVTRVAEILLTAISASPGIERIFYLWIYSL